MTLSVEQLAKIAELRAQASVKAKATRKLNIAWVRALTSDQRAQVVALVDEGFPLEDFREFAEEYSNDHVFDGTYKSFCELIEEGHDEELVADYMEYNGVWGETLAKSFLDSYIGFYGSIQEFVDMRLDGEGVSVPDWVQIDYEDTWRNLESHTYQLGDHFFSV